jgi:hypothetical protein
MLNEPIDEHYRLFHPENYDDDPILVWPDGEVVIEHEG